MATLCCIACGLFATLCAWVALPCEVHTGKASIARRCMLRARRVLEQIAEGALVTVALEREAFSSAADELCAFGKERGWECDRRTAGALLLCATAGILVLVGALTRSLMACVVVGACVAGGMRARVFSRERGRKRALAQEMPGIFRTLATAMASGNTLVQAVDYVGLHECGEANGAFVRASLRLRCGWPVNDVLERLREELDAPGVGLMATALEISQRTGSPLRELFSRSAVLVEQQGEFERMLSVKTAQVRLSVRIVCLLPPLMVCLLAIISPDYLKGLSMPTGIMCLLVATLMDALALLLIRRIMGAVL
ncbi:MAG: type II secretion system F family protein [Coriobacteriales bacterium]|nr:type II secretion system F family protein [Coriobacteriales bacterium]